MRRQAHIWRLCAALLVMAMMAGMLPAVPAASAAPTAQEAASGVEPDRGTAGTTFTFFFMGDWEPGELVKYWVVAPGAREPFALDDFFNQPDEEGRTTWTWTAPEEIWRGTWTMNARGEESFVSVQIPFVIVDENIPQVQTSVTPDRGTAGTKFTFSTDAWPEGDPVDYWVMAPGMRDPFALGLIYGEEGGRTEWSWTAPDNIWGGTWTMNARGEYSEVQITIPFVLEGPPPPPPPGAGSAPDAAVPGETITFRASGYRGGEEIAYWVSSPHTTTPIDQNRDDELYADAEGVVTVPWTVPADARPGLWSMVLLGRSSQLQQQIVFRVLEPGSAAGVPDVYVEPGAAPAGTIFHFVGSGFKPEEPLAYWVTPPEGEAFSDNRTVYADPEGNINLAWQSPADAMPGTWVMSIQGQNSVKQVHLDFVIGSTSASGEPPPPPEGVAPAAGAPGTTFSFFAEGFEQHEVVGWWPTTPQGRVLDGAVDVQTSKAGRLEWTWTAPPDAAPGTWTMTVQGKTSNLERVIRFEITGTDAPPPPPPPYSVTPEQGPPGTTFTFTAEGLVPGEDVGYWADNLRGTIYPGDTELSADQEGRLEWTWTAPDDAPSGRWLMVVKSSTSDDEVANTHISIPFVIE